MTLMSPSELRRSASSSSTAVDTVDPGNIFVNSVGAASPTLEEPFVGSKFFDSSVAKLRGPETPLRKTRGQSLSHIITPQSVGRSFSTSSLPFTPSHDHLMYAMDTPLITPMDCLHNPFEVPSDSLVKQEWNYEFNFPSYDSQIDSTTGNSMYHSLGGIDSMNSSDLSAAYQRSLLADDSFDSSISRCTSVTDSMSDLGGVTSESRSSSFSDVSQYGPLSFIGESKSLCEFTPLSVCQTKLESSCSSSCSDAAKPTTPTSAGTNPFYRPPAFLRKSTTDVPTIASLGRVAPGDTLDAGIKIHKCSAEKLAVDSMRHNTCFQPKLDLDTVTSDSLTIQCRKRSSSSSSLASDKECEKPFSCELCSKRFRRMEHLRRHAKTHTLERPYQCTVPNCGRRFSRTDNLKAHIFTHTKKCGRNSYVEGLTDSKLLKPIKRRKPKKTETQITV